MDGDHKLVVLLEQIAWFFTPILQGCIVAVLFRRRRIKLFFSFVVYLLADATRSSALWILGRSTFADAYRMAWIYSEPVMLILHVALVWGLIRLLYKTYPGIHSFAKIAISIAVLVALLFTVFSSPLNIRRPTMTESDRTLLEFFQAERVLDIGLALVVIVTVGLFPPSHYARVVRPHGFLLSALFASAAIGYFAINYGMDSELVGFLTLAFQLVLYAMWVRIFLAPEPQKLPMPSLEEVARVNQLNDDLLAFSKWIKR